MKVKITLEQATKAQESRGYSSTLSLMSALDGVRGQRHAPAPLLPGKRPGIYCIGGWVGPRAVWTGAENLATTEIRSPYRPVRNESLYRLSYRGPHL